jgi:cobalt-precorrin-6B (C15)-methyltransferase
MSIWPYDTAGIPDRFFTKGNSPITREEIRAIIMDKLRLAEFHHLVDIGAGTGSVAIEAGRILVAGRVWAVEALSERVALITENCSKFELMNVTVIQGSAPEVFDQLPQVDRAFIGGNGSKLAEIVAGLIPKLRPDGRVVMTAVTLETVNLAIKIMSQPPFRDFEGLSVNLAELLNLKELHLFQPGHTIYVLAASMERR